MQTKTSITLATAAILLFAPAATAAWSAFGDHEPSSSLDDPTLMWSDAPGAALNRIYFNGWTEINGGVNPNVGALETSHEVPTEQINVAMLGVWVDCNQDGYIGLAESAATEYESALLLDTTICPPATGSVQKWAGGHNYNGWVTELIPIGHSGGDAEDDIRDTRIHRDPAAKVWGDFGAPDDSAAAAGGSCALNPLPRGTTQSTGGVLNYVECVPNALARWNNVWRDGQNVNGQPVVPALDPTNSLGLHFSDEDDARQAGHPLHQPTFGSDDSEKAAVHTSDCNAAPIFHGGDVINQTPLGGATLNGSLHDITIWQPAPGLGNTNDPTIPGQLNRTNEETEWDSGGCNTSNDGGQDFYFLEGDDIGSRGTTSGKSSAQYNFVFRDGGRAATPPFSLIHGGAAGMDDGAGIGAGKDWRGVGALIKTTGPRSVRADLDAGTVGAAPPEMLTYYAYVSSATTSKGLITPGGSGIYGSGQCGPATSGVHEGWNCAKAEWYLNPDGSTQDEVEGGNARPGDVYLLRDVDCRDGNNNLGVPLGPAGTLNPCP